MDIIMLYIGLIIHLCLRYQNDLIAKGHSVSILTARNSSRQLFPYILRSSRH